MTPPAAGSVSRLARSRATPFQIDLFTGEEEHLRQHALKFYWFSGERGWIKRAVTIDGEECRAWTEFKIRKPSYEVTWTNSPDYHFGELTSSDPSLLDQWPREFRNSTYKQYESAGLDGRLSGLEYNGILFKARQTSKIDGRVQWVQLVDSRQRRRNLEHAPHPDADYTGLDLVYPSSSGDIFYDAPAIALYRVSDTNTTSELNQFKNYTSFAEDMQFQLYLMFMPTRPKLSR